MPGEGAILAPEWLPYAARIAPGDLSVGDLLPYRADDPNLEAGFEATGDEDVDQFAFTELGLGRKRVLSQEGRVAAAERWYSGGHGPRAEIAEKAPEQCGTCGYWLPMAGALRRCFGAVSYTHLDVYKRQPTKPALLVPTRPIARAPLGTSLT